jgi:hypothetical protein
VFYCTANFVAENVFIEQISNYSFLRIQKHVVVQVENPHFQDREISLRLIMVLLESSRDRFLQLAKCNLNMWTSSVELVPRTGPEHMTMVC